jgi:hypothetical protein
MPQYVTRREAARMIGCAPSTIRAMIARGDLTLHHLPTVGEQRLSSREVARARPRPVGRPPKS